MKRGIELIAKERQEQHEKHKRSIEQDVAYNSEQELSRVACILLQKSFNDDNSTGLDKAFRGLCPDTWDNEIFLKMYDKPYKERLIIAGALIAAELDRILTK